MEHAGFAERFSCYPIHKNRFRMEKTNILCLFDVK